MIYICTGCCYIFTDIVLLLQNLYGVVSIFIQICGIKFSDWSRLKASAR